MVISNDTNSTYSYNSHQSTQRSSTNTTDIPIAPTTCNNTTKLSIAFQSSSNFPPSYFKNNPNSSTTYIIKSNQIHNNATNHSFTLSQLSADFLISTFNCPNFVTLPFTINTTQQQQQQQQQLSQQSINQITLNHFITFAINRSKISDFTIFYTLYLLWKLKSFYPNAKGSSGHRLFISALLLAAKISCDDTYSNKSWCIVAQNIFTLKELTTMERELFTYLRFEVIVKIEQLQSFVTDVLKLSVNLSSSTPSLSSQKSQNNNTPHGPNLQSQNSVASPALTSRSTDSFESSSPLTPLNGHSWEEQAQKQQTYFESQDDCDISLSENQCLRRAIKIVTTVTTITSSS